jgi:hypothetical protein
VTTQRLPNRALAKLLAAFAAFAAFAAVTVWPASAALAADVPVYTPGVVTFDDLGVGLHAASARAA